MLSILTADQSTLLFAAALMTGLLLGSEGDTMPYLTRRYFGLISFGAIYGCVIGLAAIGGMVGPLIFGRTFDVTGNYDLILRLGAVIVIVSGLLLLLLGPYRYNVAEKHTAAAT
jgi:MFS transporter, OFA family, oxalate/formate antiporter